MAAKRETDAQKIARLEKELQERERYDQLGRKQYDVLLNAYAKLERETSGSYRGNVPLPVPVEGWYGVWSGIGWFQNWEGLFVCFAARELAEAKAAQMIKEMIETDPDGDVTAPENVQVARFGARGIPIFD